MELNFSSDNVTFISTVPELDENKISLKVFTTAPYSDELSENIVFLIDAEKNNDQSQGKYIQAMLDRKSVGYLKSYLDSFLNEKI